MSDFWLYRYCVEDIDFNGHRAIFTQTVLSEEPEAGIVATRNAVGTLMVSMTAPYGFSLDGSLYFFHSFVERIWPGPKWTTNSTSPGLSNLAPTSPECSARLQRVGASGGLGRTCIPILKDSMYTDLPHKRHMDVATWEPIMQAALAPTLTPITVAGRTYTNVIFHRKDLTWEPVIGYTLKPNPIRIWQRWRHYDVAHRLSLDRAFIPPEVDKNR